MPSLTTRSTGTGRTLRTVRTDHDVERDAQAEAGSAAGAKSSRAVEPSQVDGVAEIADGRTLRRLNSYERAVDALLDLIESGNEAPTAQQIAERSGISVRTVFRLTEDMESLHAAGLLRQMERTAHLYITLPSTGPLTTRLRTLVKNRVTVFEAIAPVRRVGDRLASSSTRITEGLDLHHMVLRTQMAEVFERELKRMPRHKRATALDAIDVAAGWETWEQLRRGKGLSVTSAARVMETLIAGALRG
jgi:AcrR family transcriptional regulator